MKNSDKNNKDTNHAGHSGKKLIAGNWKMNLTEQEARDLADSVAKATGHYTNVDFLICPTFLQIPLVLKEQVPIGAQDCAAHDNGAYTGDISARMLKEAGCSHVILGHSERRSNHKEGEGLLAEKIEQAHEHGLHVIYCVGETLDERQAGKADKIVSAQLISVLKDHFGPDNFTVAYEPVWAIGTGKTAETSDIAEMHSFIREKLQEKLESGDKIRILYGGSVKPSNASEILTIANVDGALIGGASLKADDFLAIAETA